LRPGLVCPSRCELYRPGGANQRRGGSARHGRHRPSGVLSPA
jgi:hypothetical protein